MTRNRRTFLTAFITLVLIAVIIVPNVLYSVRVKAITNPLRISMLSTPVSYAPELPVGEITENQTATSKTYYLGNNSYATDISISQVHYEDGLGWHDIDNGLRTTVLPYDWVMDKASYQTKFKEDFTAGQILQYSTQGETVDFQPMPLQWTNDLSQIQQLEIPQDVTPIVDRNSIEWVNSYGSGIDFSWTNGASRLAKLLTVSGLADLPPPLQYILDGGNPRLELYFLFDPSKGLDVYVDGQLWDKSSTQTTISNIEFKKTGNVLFVFLQPRYWDTGGLGGTGELTLSKSGNKLYVSVSVPYFWLQTAQYPVYIDPTIDVQPGASADDAWASADEVTFDISSGDIFTRRHANADTRRSAAVRFQVNINGGVTVTAASITGQVTYTSYNIYVDMYADDVNSSDDFSANQTIDSRIKTSATVSWEEVGVGGGVNQGFGTSPDISTVIQEVLDRGSWASGNYMSILLIGKTGSYADFKFYSYDFSDGSYSPQLHIEYTTGGASPAISNSPSVYDFGTLITSSTANTGLTQFMVINSSGAAIDIAISSSNMTGGTQWTISDTASPGSDIFGLKAGLSGGSYNVTIKGTSPFNNLIENLADSANVQWGAKIWAPDVFSDGVEKSGNIVLTASLS